jgi:glycosyltransferase involved in cell wall biosynthesis
MSKVIHIVPSDGIGGVEVAARSIGFVRQGDLEFSVDYIFREFYKVGEKTLFRFNPIPFFLASWRASRKDVDLVIVSLWRSGLVGLFAKLLRPKLKLVVFLHSSKDAHLVDYIVIRLAVWFATEIWADSLATLRSIVPGIPNNKCRIISFVTRRFQPVPEKAVDPSFIFWGRINQSKGLDRAIRLFAEVYKSSPTACFRIIGPDGGALSMLKELSISLEIEDKVIFHEALAHDEIVDYAHQASFYLQTSKFEGMAMSVVESMQLGLVPVVTPVGEIGNYCICDYNAIIVESDQRVVSDILRLLNSDATYQQLRVNAIATWNDKSLYKDSILVACRAVLGLQDYI